MRTFAPTENTVIEFNEALNRGDVDGMMRLMTDDCMFENTYPAPDGTAYRGKDAVRRFWEDFFLASPHAHIEVEEIFATADRCILRWRYNWAAADGQTGHVRGVDVYRVQDGLIREKLSYVKG